MNSAGKEMRLEGGVPSTFISKVSHSVLNALTLNKVILLFVRSFVPLCLFVCLFGSNFRICLFVCFYLPLTNKQMMISLVTFEIGFPRQTQRQVMPGCISNELMECVIKKQGKTVPSEKTTTLKQRTTQSQMYLRESFVFF